MKILVTGPGGFVGASLCGDLIKNGHFVRKALRTSKENNAGSNEEALKQSASDSILVGNIGPETEWTGVLESMDAVVHLAARVHVMHEDAKDPLSAFRRINVAGTERLARAASACGVKRFVYVSSIKVNGEQTLPGQKFSSLDIPDPEDPYGISKFEAERSLANITEETGLEVVIVRPPLVYGPGVKGNFLQMMKVVSRGQPLPFSSIHNRRSLIYVNNLTDALVNCVISPNAAGKTFLVSDGEDISTPELLRSLAKYLGVPSRLFPCPPAILRGLARFIGKEAQADRLLGSLQVDGDKICRELNWVPPYTQQEGLRKTAEWYRKQNT